MLKQMIKSNINRSCKNEVARENACILYINFIFLPVAMASLVCCCCRIIDDTKLWPPTVSRLFIFNIPISVKLNGMPINTASNILCMQFLFPFYFLPFFLFIFANIKIQLTKVSSMFQTVYDGNDFSLAPMKKFTMKKKKKNSDPVA